MLGEDADDADAYERPKDDQEIELEAELFNDSHLFGSGDGDGDGEEVRRDAGASNHLTPL